VSTPAERRTHASIAANTRWANEPDRAAATAAARAKGPGSLEYWIAKTDPDLPHAERVKRANNLKQVFYQKLAASGRKAKAAKSARKRRAA